MKGTVAPSLRSWAVAATCCTRTPSSLVMRRTWSVLSWMLAGAGAGVSEGGRVSVDMGKGKGRVQPLRAAGQGGFWTKNRRLRGRRRGGRGEGRMRKRKGEKMAGDGD